MQLLKHPPSAHDGTTTTCTMCDFPPKPDLEALGQELFEASLEFSGCDRGPCEACWMRLRTAWMNWANRKAWA